MYATDDRDAVQAQLAQRATEDPAITAAALLGSLASGGADRWSDIDMALRIADEADERFVVKTWTDSLYAEHGAVHHVDLWDQRTRYRAFLLENTMQVDLSFWPAQDFLSLGRPVSPIFGETGDPLEDAEPDAELFVGMGWLYAVHVRSALARRRLWQAVHMIDGIRDQLIGLACLRHGLPAHQGRGVDRLPAALQEQLAATRAPSVDARDLGLSFAAAVEVLLGEIAMALPELGDRLGPALRRLAA